ncbi:MAG: beta-ketoacyl synthase N-terminal-like domain-containing protein, partial [Bacteroidota bacterium]
MKPIYINGAARIGACPTVATGPFPIAEPDYTQYVPKKKLRRMDRLTRFALHTTYAALEEADLTEIDGVIMGVGQTVSKIMDGMLRKMIDQQEGLTNPTSFMNSLLSTAAGQVALQLSCNGYTNTHSQRGFSLESALLDAAVFLDKNTERQLVVGGLDVTHESYAELADNYGHLAANSTEGIVRPVGEGAATFVVGAMPSPRTQACIREIYTAFLTETARREWSAIELGQTLFNGAPPTADLIISGRPLGNEAQELYADILSAFPSETPIIEYKRI